MSPRPAQAVGRVDGGGRQGLVEAEPEVDTGKVHDYGHAHTVRVRVEVRAEGDDHTVVQHGSHRGMFQSQNVGGGGQDHSHTAGLSHRLHPLHADLEEGNDKRTEDTPD